MWQPLPAELQEAERTLSPSTDSAEVPSCSTRIRDNVGIPIELALASVDQRLREEGIRDNVSIVVGEYQKQQ